MTSSYLLIDLVILFTSGIVSFLTSSPFSFSEDFFSKDSLFSESLSSTFGKSLSFYSSFNIFAILCLFFSLFLLFFKFSLAFCLFSAACFFIKSSMMLCFEFRFWYLTSSSISETSIPLLTHHCLSSYQLWWILLSSITSYCLSSSFSWSRSFFLIASLI